MNARFTRGGPAGNDRRCESKPPQASRRRQDTGWNEVAARGLRCHLDPQTGSVRLLLADQAFWESSRTSLLSSHLGRQRAQDASWWDAFRDALADLVDSDTLLVTAAGTTVDRWLRTAARLWGMRLAELCLPSPGADFEGWLREVLAMPSDPAASGIVCHVSPAIPLSKYGGSRGPSRVTLESDFHQTLDTHVEANAGKRRATRDGASDRLLLELADEIRVLCVREKGCIAGLLDTLAGRAEHALKGVLLDTREELVSAKQAGPWLARGATRNGPTMSEPTVRLQQALSRSECWPTVNACRIDESCPLPRRSDRSGLIRVWADVDGESEEYLNHWTRDCPGPWPGQSDEEYLLEMLLRPSARGRTAFDALVRILREQRLRASGRLVRGRMPVVSFSARPLREFPRLRRFRRHLGRWDFNPLGIALRTDWLRAQGARPVIYGDRHLWNQLAAEDRPFFQFSRGPRYGIVDHLGSQSPDATPPERAASRGNSDWTLEQEWRHLGDVDLSQVPEDAVRVFVSDLAAARRLASMTAWTVVSLEVPTGSPAADNGLPRRRP